MEEWSLVDQELFNSDSVLVKPLARRMRPVQFSHFEGQEHVREQIARFSRLLEEGRLFSFIIFGPPGTGKSAFAALVAGISGARFVSLNAVTSSVAEVKDCIRAAAEAAAYHEQRTVLFIDEIHRFNKMQQDALLPAVEDGTVYLIGVTTQNPSFSVNPALRSRCHILEFKLLDDEALSRILDRALEDESSGLGRYGYTLSGSARSRILRAASGDARRALNLLELAAVPGAEGKEIPSETVDACLGGSSVEYDRDGDSHYDVTSAFIKSIRGSDPDATIHYLARMIEGGEDPRFIARRIMISASEDVGLADSGALSVAVSAAQAVERIGMPEGALILSHAALRVCLAPKSNSACKAIGAARSDIRENGPLPIPDYLKDAHYKDAAALGRGVGYKYPHDYPGHFVEQEYLSGSRSYYSPCDTGNEHQLAAAHVRRKGGAGGV